MKNLKLIWSIFTFIFLILSIYHFYLSTINLNKIELIEIPEKLGFLVTEDFPDDFDMYDPLKQFLNDFNSQVARQNNFSSHINKISALGYFLACLTSLFSAFQIKKET